MWVRERESEDVSMWRCEDEQMWRWEDVKMSRCEDEQMWRWADVKMSRCEDEQMWRWEGVKMRRCEDEKVWEKVWRWEDEIQTPTIGRTLRSDALGNKNFRSCVKKNLRDINNTQTITQIHFVTFMFALVYVLAIFMSCVYARRKIKPYFARIRSYVNINQKNAAVNGKVWICREYTFCLRTRCRLCMRMRGPVQDGLYCGSLWNSAKTPTTFRSISGLALLSVIHNNLSYRLPIFETSATA